MKRILWLQFGVWGDALLSTVALQQLRRDEPDAHITWLIFDLYREVACKCPLVDDVITFPVPKRRKRQEVEIGIWTWMKAYALEMVDTGHADEIRIPQIYPDHPWQHADRKMCLADHQCLNAGVAIPDQWTDRTIQFQPTDRDETNLVSRLRGWDDYAAAFSAGIVPCNARSQTQPAVWTDARYVELSELLAKDNLLLVLGDCNIGDLPRFDGSLGEWVTLIDRTGLHLGLDSGGTWAAAATDARQIVLYPDNPIVPRWLSGLNAMNVKDGEEVVEMTAPGVKQVRDAIYDQCWLDVDRAKEQA